MGGRAFGDERQRLDAGVLSQFVLYAVISAGSVGGLTEVWSEISRASGALERIGELLATSADIVSPVNPAATGQPRAWRQIPLRQCGIPLPDPGSDAPDLARFRSACGSPGETGCPGRTIRRR